MRPFRRARPRGFSEELKDLAQRMIQAYGITPLAPGERRDPDYYGVGWFTMGKPLRLPPPKPRDDER